MPTPAKKMKFGDWLPDQEALDNPGLTICQNAIMVGANYVPYLPVGNYGSGGALPYQFIRALRVRSFAVSYVIAAVRDPLLSRAPKIFFGAGAGGTWTDVTPTGVVPTDTIYDWSLAQYGLNVIATNYQDGPYFSSGLGATTFVPLTGVGGAAPAAGVVSVIGQFVVLGNIPSASVSAVQWSVINDPTNWPTPGSAPAIAGQSGIQFLDASLGSVQGILGGDQWGVILCDGGLVRMTYVGGSVVFQFDTYAREPGPAGEYAMCRIGQKIYFAGSGGFRVTDGVTTASIGEGRVDTTFQALLAVHNVMPVQCGVDYVNKLIYWTVYTTLTNCTQFIYNYDEDKWTSSNDLVMAHVQREEIEEFPVLEAFGSTLQCGTLTGTPGTATLETGEVELNPGSRALVSGYRPQVSGSSPAVTVQIGSRASQGSAVTYTAALTPNAITGFADCLVDANYHRASIAITGAFAVAIGGEFRAQPSGSY